MAELPACSRPPAPRGPRRSAAPASMVIGTGRERAADSARRLAARLDAGRSAVAIGRGGRWLGGRGSRPGDLVVATELRTPDGSRPPPWPAAALLAGELRRAGLRVRTGPIVSAPPVVAAPSGRAGRRRARIAVGHGVGVVADALGRPAARGGAGGRRHRLTQRRRSTGGLRALRASRARRPALETLGGGRRSAARCCWPAPGRSAPASSGPSRPSNGPSTASGRRSTSAGRSSTTPMWSPTSRPGAPCSSRSSTRCPTAPTVVLAAHGVSPAVRRQAAARPDLEVDRRHLPAGGQGPPRGPALRRPGLPHRPGRPRRPRRGGRHRRRGARRHPPGRRRRRRRRRSISPTTPVAYLTQTTLADRRDRRGGRRPCAAASRPRRPDAPTTSATPPRTARTRCGRWPATAT